MDLRQAQQVASQLANALAPSCERIEIAGSVRRLKPNPKDVEIVFIPAMVERQVDLFSTAPVPATDEAIAGLVQASTLAWDTEVKRNGPKYKRPAESQTIRATPATPKNADFELVTRVTRCGGPQRVNIVSAPNSC